VNMSSAKTILMLIFLLYGSICAIQITRANESVYLDAVKNLKMGWMSETLYQTKPLSPISICETNDPAVLILDREMHEVVELDEDGSVSTFLSTGGLAFDAIGYQPLADRLVAIGNSAFYIYGGEAFTILEEYPAPVSFTTLIVDPSDDSIYTASAENNSKIYHFTSNGEFISTVRAHVQGGSQLAIDPIRNWLYFSETFTGRITRLDLTMNTTTILNSGIAIPGTGEGISVATDSTGTLYYYVAEGVGRGFHRYNGTDFEFLLAPKDGIGPMIWSNRLNAALCVPGGGGCVVKYDPAAVDPERLTPSVNVKPIVQMANGSILLGIDKTIYIISEGQLIEFVSELPMKCGSLILDASDKLYVGLENDSALIVTLNSDGSLDPWFSRDIDGLLIALCYDSKNNALVLMTNDPGQRRFDVWRLPIEDPYDYRQVVSIENETSCAMTVDRSGNIFILERRVNTLYRIPDGSTQKQVLFTDVVEHAYMVYVNLGYSRIEEGVVLCRNDDLQVWLASGDGAYLLAENNVGIDNSGIFETMTGDLICTHSGQIYRLSYSSEATFVMDPVLIAAIAGGFIAVAGVLVVLHRRND
jgi:sugar lactone lactonase YvrE